MNDILLSIIKELFTQWTNDIRFVEGHMWMIYTVIPAVLYFIFFFVKWTALTAPVWLPISLALGRMHFIKTKKGR